MASQNSVITHYRRASLAKATSGAIGKIAKVTHIALGDGGVDSEGNVLPPSEMQTVLRSELGRYPVSDPQFPVETTARYSITIPEQDLVGAAISEMALVDEDGQLCAIRATPPKTKDSDEEFTFVFDDEF